MTPDPLPPIPHLLPHLPIPCSQPGPEPAPNLPSNLPPNLPSTCPPPPPPPPQDNSVVAPRLTLFDGSIARFALDDRNPLVFMMDEPPENMRDQLGFSREASQFTILAREVYSQLCDGDDEVCGGRTPGSPICYPNPRSGSEVCVAGALQPALGKSFGTGADGPGSSFCRGRGWDVKRAAIESAPESVDGVLAAGSNVAMIARISAGAAIGSVAAGVLLTFGALGIVRHRRSNDRVAMRKSRMSAGVEATAGFSQ